MSLTSAEAQQVRTQPAGESVTSTTNKDNATNILDKGSGGFTGMSEANISLNSTVVTPVVATCATPPTASVASPGTNNGAKTNVQYDSQFMRKQHILDELQVILEFGEIDTLQGVYSMKS